MLFRKELLENRDMRDDLDVNDDDDDNDNDDNSVKCEDIEPRRRISGQVLSIAINCMFVSVSLSTADIDFCERDRLSHRGFTDA